MNTQDIFKLLIYIGDDIEHGIAPPNHIIDSLKPFSQINLVREKYCVYARSLTNSQLVASLKGLTYVERKLNWSGGSVATGKYLFGAILMRDLSMAKKKEIANWILCNSNNHFWSPRGPCVGFYSESVSDYEASDPNYGKSIRIETEDKVSAESAKAKNKRAYIHQCRKEPARLELIQKLNNMSVTEQLEMISGDDEYPVKFYPTRCAKLANIRVIESLSPEIRLALILKMKGKFKGPWGRFKKRLSSVYGVPESHSLWGG